MVNQITKEAGLTVNVNTVKSNMKSYYASHGMEKPQFKGGQIAIAACLQKFCEYLLRNVHKLTTVDKSGVRRVVRTTFRASILSHDGLSEYFMAHFRHFNKKMTYLNELPMTMKDVQDLCESVDKEMVFGPKAINLLAFCLTHAYLDMVDVSHMFLTHSRKKQLDGNTVMYAIRCRFNDSIAHELCAEVERAMKACNLEVKTMEEDEDGEVPAEEAPEESGDEEEEEVETKAKGKPAKETKESTKEVAKETKETKESTKNSKETKEVKETKESAKNTKGKKVPEKKIEVEDGSDDDAVEEDDEEEAVEAKPKSKGAQAVTTAPKPEKEEKPAPASVNTKARRNVKN